MNIPTPEDPEDKDKEIPYSKSLPVQESPKSPALIRRRKSTSDTISMGVHFFRTQKIIDPTTNKSRLLVVQLTPEQLAAIPNKEAIPDDDAILTTVRINPTQNKS